MDNTATAPRLEDLASVGTRVSWGAILAGTLLALGVFFLLATLGSAVGLSASDRTNATNLSTGVIIWAFVTTIAALFVGGLVTSLFTAGENKIEAVLSAIIVWALLGVVLLVLSAAGIKAGFNAMMAIGNTAQNASAQNWESGAREAGVSPEQIEDWRRKNIATAAAAVQDPQNRQAALDAATRISWYAFAGTWLAMLAAALGGLVGAGPTFRLVAVRRSYSGSAALPHAQKSPAYART